MGMDSREGQGRWRTSLAPRISLHLMLIFLPSYLFGLEDGEIFNMKHQFTHSQPFSGNIRCSLLYIKASPTVTEHNNGQYSTAKKLYIKNGNNNNVKHYHNDNICTVNMITLVTDFVVIIKIAKLKHKQNKHKQLIWLSSCQEIRSSVAQSSCGFIILC